jgi:DNA-directed RNA polymerase specialized sigma24 family protein
VRLGVSNREIGERLYVSVNTVKTHSEREDGRESAAIGYSAQ